MLVTSDDYSRYVDVDFLKKKSDAPAALQDRIELWEKPIGSSVVTVMCDNGTELVSQGQREYYRKKGIQLLVIVPYKHFMNGAIEIWNQIIVARGRTALIQSGLPHTLWEEAMSYAKDVTVNVPCSANKDMMPPVAAFKGIRANVRGLYAFGSAAWVFDHIDIISVFRSC